VLPLLGKILVDAAVLAFYTQRSLALTAHRSNGTDKQHAAQATRIRARGLDVKVWRFETKK